MAGLGQESPGRYGDVSLGSFRRLTLNVWRPPSSSITGFWVPVQARVRKRQKNAVQWMGGACWRARGTISPRTGRSAT